MKIASIVGARPEFVQAAMVSVALRKRHEEILIHTGQHYDDLMSDVFFRELSLPMPDVNLNVGSGPASKQTAHLLERLAATFDDIKPDLVIVRGDTNSTLAAALAARQNSYPLVHIEAGMRSFDRSMPEENNRVITDHISDVLFATGEDAAENLHREGLSNVHITGDVMYDTYLRVVSDVLPRHNMSLNLPADFYLLTIHRSGNTDDPDVLNAIISAFAAAPRPVVFPVHPRTAKQLKKWNISLPAPILPVPPLSYLDMLTAERNALTIFTDSGGVQREAYFSGVPCVTLRENTEWGETVDTGWNCLAGCDTGIIRGYLKDPPQPPSFRPPIFGQGNAAERITEILDSGDVAERIERWTTLRRSSEPKITAA
jgi:UDP-N-acetylglucosamine 2-epimerase